MHEVFLPRLIHFLPFLLNHLRVPPPELEPIPDKVKVKVKVTLRRAVYRQSLRLGVKPLETHDQTFYNANLHILTCIHSI
jgi:hypothetical protein